LTSSLGTGNKLTFFTVYICLQLKAGYYSDPFLAAAHTFIPAFVRVSSPHPICHGLRIPNIPIVGNPSSTSYRGLAVQPLLFTSMVIKLPPPPLHLLTFFPFKAVMALSTHSFFLLPQPYLIAHLSPWYSVLLECNDVKVLHPGALTKVLSYRPSIKAYLSSFSRKGKSSLSLVHERISQSFSHNSLLLSSSICC
jgi:hypothetical protein